MRLLVVGASGQLGADLVRLAESDDALHVVPLTRAEIDLRKRDDIGPALADRRADVVVNCAAYNDTAGAESDPVAAFAVNAYAPERLAVAAREMGARFVQVSSDYVFDGTAGRPYAEDDAPAPLGVYGASKLAGEALARRAYPGGTMVVRTAALFGLAGRRTGNFVETVLGALERGDPLRVVRDIVISPTGTAELARGLIALLRADPGPGTYHRVCAGRASWHELATAIVDAVDADVAVEPVSAAEFPSRVRRPAFSVLADRIAAERAGPMPPWRQALAEYLTARAQSPQETTERGTNRRDDRE